MSQIDLGSKITLDDGTEISVADLVQSHKDLKDAVAANDLLQQDLSNVGKLFRGDVPQDERTEAMQNILTQLGYSDEQISAYIGAISNQPAEADPDEEEDEVEEIDLPDLPEDGDDIEDEAPETSGGSKERTMSDEQERVLRQELEAQRAELHKMRVRELRERLDSELNRVIERNPEIQKLLTASRTLRGDEGVEQAKSTLRSQLERGALERMQARRATAGTFEDAWMSEEVDKAAEPVLGTFRSVIGDIDKLGRSSETVTGLDAQEILRSKPVPEPEYKEGATISDIESQVKSFASDTIKRALASSPGESAI